MPDVTGLESTPHHLEPVALVKLTHEQQQHTAVEQVKIQAAVRAYLKRQPPARAGPQAGKADARARTPRTCGWSSS